MRNLRIAIGAAVLLLGLLPHQSMQQPPLQWDPMFAMKCPVPAGNCTRGRSLVPSRDNVGVCCPSCDAYSSPSCDNTCLKLNLSATPCFSACGNAGCQRAMCGEPVDGGSRCCNATKIFNCQPNKIFLGADCCPDCNRGSAANPNSPPHCRFNQTRGAGQPVCNPLGNCQLQPVDDRRDDNQFSFDLIGRVCPQSDLMPFLELITLGSNSMTSATMMPNLMAMNASMPPPTMPPMNPDAMKAVLNMYGAYLRNLSRLPEVVQRITSPTCREPMICIAKMYNQSVPLIKAALDAILSQVSSPTAGSAPPNLATFMENVTARMGSVMSQGAACMAMIQSQTPCVAKVQAINMEELLRHCRCNRSSPFEFALLQGIAGRVANQTASNKPPGLDMFQDLNCSALRNPCIADFLNALMERVSSGCADAQLLQAARVRMRSVVTGCVNGNFSQLTDEDLINGLAHCTFSADDIRRIAAESPSKLTALVLNATAVPSGAVPGMAGNATVGNMIQAALANCMDLKAAFDQVVGQHLDPNLMTPSNAKDMVNVIKANVIDKIKVWQNLTADELVTLSEKLKDDPDRDAKCQQLVRMVNQTLLGKLKACIDKIPTDKLPTLFPGGAQLEEAVMSYNFSAMAPRDAARNAPALREMLKDVMVNETNCLTYMNILFSLPKEKIDRSLCLNDTCFRNMCSVMPNHPNTAYCQDMRPPPTAAKVAELSRNGMIQLTQAEISRAISNNITKDFVKTVLATFATSSSSDSSITAGISARISAQKTRSTVGAVMFEFQKTFLQGSNLDSFSASDIDASVLCQLNFEQLSRLPCSQMSTVAYKAKSYLGNVGTGAGTLVTKCICESYANCSNITSAALTDMGSFAMFISAELISKIPSSSLPTYCQALQAVGTYEKSTKLALAHQRLIHDLCAAHTDMSGSGGSNDTDLNLLPVWNSTVVSAVMHCALTTVQIGKLDQSAAEYVIRRLWQCPPNVTYLGAICVRYFQLYNQSATSGNYSTSLVRMCYAFMQSNGNASKVSQSDVRTDCGTVATDAAQVNDSCFERASHGHQADCASAQLLTLSNAIANAQRHMIGVIDGSSGSGAGRRKKRSTTALTCNDVQNLASGVAQLTAAQIQAMAQSEFQTCFSTFGLANALWSSDQCAQLKSKTEAAYNGTSMWTSTVLLTVGCMTQCWSASEIARIPYSDVSHISDIGKYCKLMPSDAKTAIVSSYIANAKANDSSRMTRSELGALGYLACGALPAYVDAFNVTNVFNALTELGTPGPCSSDVMLSYVNRLKAGSLGGTVSSWQSSYFTSLANLISGLSDADIPTLSSGQIGYIDASVISSMSTNKLKDFTPSQLSAFSSSQKSAVTSDQLAQLTASQKAALGYSVSSGAEFLTVNLMTLLTTLGVACAVSRWQLSM